MNSIMRTLKSGKSKLVEIKVQVNNRLCFVDDKMEIELKKKKSDNQELIVHYQVATYALQDCLKATQETIDMYTDCMESLNDSRRSFERHPNDRHRTVPHKTGDGEVYRGI